MPRTLLALALLLASASTPALAEGEKQAAEELVRVITPRESYESMISQMTNQTVAQRAGGKQLPPGTAEKIKQVLLEALPYEDMISLTSELYAQRFTAAELREIAAFYKSPVGRKAVRLLPELTVEAMNRASTMVVQRMPGLMRKHGLIPPDSEEKKDMMKDAPRDVEKAK